MEETLLLSDREARSIFFRLPKLPIQIIGMVILTLVSLFFFPSVEIESIVAAISIFLIPTLLSVFFLPYFKSLNARMNLRQSGTIASISLTSTVITFILLILMSMPVDQAILISVAFPISFRFLSNTGMYQNDPKRSFIPSSIQSLLPLPFFQIFYDFDLMNVSAYIITFFLGSVLVLLLVNYINKPFVKDLGTPTMKVANMIIKAINGNLEGKKEFEDFFGENSVEGEIEYKIFSFRKKNSKEKKAIFVLPGMHAGPLKGIGGSKLPLLLSEGLDDFQNIFTFHSPSNHSLNPVREDDCDLLIESVKEDLGNLEYNGKATKFIQEDGGAIVGAQGFGDDVLTNLSFYPEPAEDIHASIDKIISLKGDSYGFENVGVIDSHNCGTRRVSNVFYPTKKAKRVIKKSSKVLEKVKKAEKSDLKMGVSAFRGYENSGIANEGIKVALFKVEDQLNCQILIDGNNMIPDFRGELIGGIEDLVDTVEIHTSDTHEVNTLLRSHYPLGENISSERLIKDMRKLIKKATKDLEPVEVAAKTNTIENFEIMGNVNTGRMNAVSETMLKILPFSIVMTLSFQLVLTLLIFSLFW